MTAMQNTLRKKVAEILLIEDNPQDVLLTQNAFKALEIPYNITIARSGEHAWDMLQKSNYSFSNSLSLILLDLNLPKMEGIELLKKIKSDENLQDIPVIVLTGSVEQNHVVASYDLHAVSYITKPINLERQHIIEDLLKIRRNK